MDFKNSIVLVAITVSVVFQQASCLRCYSCNNNIEPKCGKTWELSEKEAAKYIETCEGENVACKKIDTTDSVKGKLIVTRSCWNTSSEINEEILDCTALGKVGTACYCEGNGSGNTTMPCNGTQPVLTYLSLVMIIVSVIFSLIL